MGTAQRGGGGVALYGAVVCLVGDARREWGLKGEGIAMLVCLLQGPFT